VDKPSPIRDHLFGGNCYNAVCIAARLLHSIAEILYRDWWTNHTLAFPQLERRFQHQC
jgi:hypothetical protein